MDIGSHGHTHARLTGYNTQRLIRRRHTRRTLGNLYRIFSRSEVDRIASGLGRLAQIHRSSVDRQMARVYGVTSPEFLGGVLFSSYLMHTATEDHLYTA